MCLALTATTMLPFHPVQTEYRLQAATSSPTVEHPFRNLSFLLSAAVIAVTTSRLWTRLVQESLTAQETSFQASSSSPSFSQMQFPTTRSNAAYPTLSLKETAWCLRKERSCFQVPMSTRTTVRQRHASLSARPPHRISLSFASGILQILSTHLTPRKYPITH